MAKSAFLPDGMRFAKAVPVLVLAVLAASAFAQSAATPKRKGRAAAPPPAGALPKAQDMRLLQPGELPLAAKGAIVLDGVTGKTLYEKDSDTPYFPASTTKVMTALLVIESGGLDHVIEVTEEDARVGESGLSIKTGDRFTRLEALYGLMLKSANDVAHALARDNAGTMLAFAEKMTLRARELGATNTSFKNPHGLHHPQHYTSARDLAVITRAAMEQPLFRKIVATRYHTWIAATGPWELRNHNRLLGEFEGCTGVKTGYTNPAQHTLATAALRQNREVIGAVLYSHKQGKWEDSKLLLTFGLENENGRVATP